MNLFFPVRADPVVLVIQVFDLFEEHIMWLGRLNNRRCKSRN